MTSVEPLFSPPPVYVLPLSKGGDLAVDFLNDPDEDETFEDYGVGVTVTLIIEADASKTPPSPAVSAVATVNGHHAVVKVESTVADTIASGVKWRLILSTPTSPSTETVAANGKVKRFDG